MIDALLVGCRRGRRNFRQGIALFFGMFHVEHSCHSEAFDSPLEWGCAFPRAYRFRSFGPWALECSTWNILLLASAFGSNWGIIREEFASLSFSDFWPLDFSVFNVKQPGEAAGKRQPEGRRALKRSRLGIGGIGGRSRRMSSMGAGKRGGGLECGAIPLPAIFRCRTG